MKAYIFYKHFFNSTGETIMIGGIETYLFNLANILKERNIEPLIIQSASLDFEKVEKGIAVRGYQLKGRNLYKKLYLKVKQQITDDDLIIWGLDRAAVEVPNKRTISIQHGIPFDYYQEEIRIRSLLRKLGFGHTLKAIQRRMAIKAFKRAAFKVCVDYNFWNWYRTFCLPEEEKNIFVIPNFAQIDTGFCDNSVAEKDKNVLNVLFARRFVRMRGVEDFIEVAKFFKDDMRVTITFAGEGPYEKQIEDLVHGSQNIYMTKYDAGDAIEFHRGYDVAVVPSIASEGTSLSLLEAMAAGNVVICTCVGGMTNIILDGFNGFFVKPNTPQEIVQIIEKLLLSPALRNRMSQQAQLSVKDSFSYVLWREKWNAVINAVCNL